MNLKNIDSIGDGEVFSFSSSLRPFILIYKDNEPLFLNIETWEAYPEKDLKTEELFFYPNHSVNSRCCSVFSWYD